MQEWEELARNEWLILRIICEPLLYEKQHIHI